MYDLAIFLALMAMGYIIGGMRERKHFKSLIKRESQLREIHTSTVKTPPEPENVLAALLVGGNVVISIDYFKRFAAGLRNLVGGRVSSYESLVERARREALLRMKENALNFNAESVFNVRLETASITKGRGKQIGSVEVYAYGTAIVRKG